LQRRFAKRRLRARASARDRFAARTPADARSHVCECALARPRIRARTPADALAHSRKLVARANAEHARSRSESMSGVSRSTTSAHREGAEVRLLLRAHAEAKWLTSRVIPVVRELEREPRRPRRHEGTTLAYLEVLWIEACGRAAETDGARVELDTPRRSGDALHERARRYHAAVRRMRADTAPRVQRLIDPRRHLAARKHSR
jgi:hypothetical protein